MLIELHCIAGHGRSEVTSDRDCWAKVVVIAVERISLNPPPCWNSQKSQYAMAMKELCQPETRKLYP